MNEACAIAACLWLLAGCATLPATPPLEEAQLERYVVVTLRNEPGPGIPRAGSTARTYEAPSAYSVAPATRASARALAAAHGLREVSAWPIGLLGVHCIVFEIPLRAERGATLDRLRRDPRVESAQPMQSFATLSTPNDPYRRLQHNLDVMDVNGAHHWSRGEGVKIAIVDTGVDARHPDLAGRIVKQIDFVEDGRPGARDRHGTAVAGVIAAVENNQQGIIGIAPAAQLYAMRACWPAPHDEARALCNTLTLAKAIASAIDARMDVVNLSLTGPTDPLLVRLVEAGLRRGVVFVGAVPARDSGRSFPSGVAGVISVDASGSNSLVPAVLFAPGKDVLTLVPEGSYDFVSGSSLAAASVTGGIALLLARSADLRAEDARRILARSSRSVRTEQGSLASINLCTAVAALLPGPPPCN
jgi:Subtilase family